MIKKIIIKPLENPYPLSASRINLFLECPVHYWFRYRTELPRQEITWPGTLNGSALHQVVEDFLNNRKKYQEIYKKTKDVNSILKLTPSFREIFDKLLIEHKDTFRKSKKYDYEEFIKKGEKFKKVLTNFCANYFFQDEVIAEQNFKAPWFEDDFSLTGYIDILIKHEDKYFIADLKTTTDSNKYYSMEWNKNIQSIIYTYLIFKKFKKFPEAFSFIVLNHEDKLLFLKEKDFNAERFEEQLAYLDLVIGQIREFNKIKDLTKIAEYKSGKCQWCDYKKICEELK